MKLATIEKITEVKAHPGADRLDLVKVLGYTCVVQKGLYKVGDFIVYIKTDTVLPDSGWAAGYKKYAPNRVRAVKIREIFSEGVIVPINLILNELRSIDLLINNVGYDVTDRLNITKFIPPIPQDLDAKSSVLPYQMSATDEDRWENFLVEDSPKNLPYGKMVDLTLKIDGQSCTIGYNLEDDYFFITTRNQELKLDSINNYTYCAKRHDIENKIKSYCKKYNISLALRGEVYGKGVQSSKNNPHSKENVNVAFFDTYDLTARRYHRKGSLHYFENVCNEMNLPIVDLIESDVILTQDLIDYYSNLDGDLFEGVVIKHSNGSFKIINKHYDSKK